MANSVKDSFLDLERHRQALEANIEKLRKSLQHWQTWEAEYEGLKEEISAITPPPTRDQLVAIGRAYDGVLVTRTEVEDILGVKIPRSAEQAINILSRRIDYVGQNVNTVSKQLEVAENKLAVATVISAPDVRNEDGLPITEIIEELDDEGNEISSHISTPGSAKEQLREVLQKAGLKDQDLEEPDVPPPEPDHGDMKTAELQPPSQDLAASKKPPRKTVKFSEDTKDGAEIKPSPSVASLATKANLVDKQSLSTTATPVIPVDESEEDATLRRQMLQYGMQEMGAIVAELELEEGGDFSDDEDYDYDDLQDSSDEEDEFGRSTRNVIDDEMRLRMAELEAKLGVRMMENAGPEHKGLGEQEGLQHERAHSHSEVISDVTLHSDQEEPDYELQASAPNPGTPSISPSEPSHSEKVTPLRIFSSQSNSQPGTKRVPTGPPGQSLANNVVEREVVVRDALEPDEFDPTLLQAQAASEYHRMRNKMIQRQGGFAKPEEGAIIPFSEEEGGPKKVSRFKAARLSKV